jgi:hypothetical protein
MENNPMNAGAQALASRKAERDAHAEQIAALTSQLEAALQGPKSVFVLIDSDERVLHVHCTENGANEHRAKYSMPSWIKVEEWQLEP